MQAATVFRCHTPDNGYFHIPWLQRGNDEFYNCEVIILNADILLLQGASLLSTWTEGTDPCDNAWYGVNCTCGFFGPLQLQVFPCPKPSTLSQSLKITSLIESHAKHRVLTTLNLSSDSADETTSGHACAPLEGSRRLRGIGSESCPNMNIVALSILLSIQNPRVGVFVSKYVDPEPDFKTLIRLFWCSSHALWAYTTTEEGTSGPVLDLCYI